MTYKSSLVITDALALKLAKKFKINLKVIPLKWYKAGLKVELEHSTPRRSSTNVAHENIILVAKIVLAHLYEFPDYYQRLKKWNLVQIVIGQNELKYFYSRYRS